MKCIANKKTTAREAEKINELLNFLIEKRRSIRFVPMKTQLSTALFVLITFVSIAQNSSPYEWDWKKDGPLLGVSLAGSAAGFLLIQNKDGFTEEEIAAFQLKKDNINFVDKWVAGKDSERASTLSDIPFYTAFAMPVVLFLDDETNNNAGQVLGMYVESMATTGALFTIAAGVTNRARPYVYSDDYPLDEKLESTATRSFYSGHVAATATATFFTAKVYSDFNPESPALPYVWAGAAAIPAAVAYLRLEAGQHFLTDVLLGYTMGALVGYFIPELHKNNRAELSIAPTGGLDYLGREYRAMAISLKF